MLYSMFNIKGVSEVSKLLGIPLENNTSIVRRATRNVTVLCQHIIEQALICVTYYILADGANGATVFNSDDRLAFIPHTSAQRGQTAVTGTHHYLNRVAETQRGLKLPS